VDDAARIIGCWKALSKQGLTHDLAHDPQPMKRAVAIPTNRQVLEWRCCA
jgi:predicted helicase